VASFDQLRAAIQAAEVERVTEHDRALQEEPRP